MRRTELPCIKPSFIGAWYLDRPELCEGIIGLFEANRSMHKPGRMAYGVNPAAKNSMDLLVNPTDLQRPSHRILADYFRELHACYLDYLEQWPFLASMLTEMDIGAFNIQKYNAGGHFAAVHSERTSLDNAHRVLAWMTYLNDVEGGGQTAFAHYGLEVAPECGKTLIWPAEWTHAHSGKVVNAGSKYIVTGWMHFPPRKTTERLRGSRADMPPHLPRRV